MIETTNALLWGAGALGIAAVAGLAALRGWEKHLKIKTAKLAIEKIQSLNIQVSDEQIDKIYRNVRDKADEAHGRATSSVINDVSSAYIALTAAIMNDLGGLYDLGEGIFEMVLAVRDSLHMELEIIAPVYSLPVDGESISVYPNNPNRGVERNRLASVNHEMTKHIIKFHEFWRHEAARKSDMKKFRNSLGLALNSDDKFKKDVLRLMNLEE